MPIDTSQTLLTSDPEAEECFLGTLLFDPDTFYQAGWLTPDDFQIERNRWVFEAICRRHEAGGDCSFLEVVQDLRNIGKIGPGLIELAYVMELQQRPPSYNHAEHYARRVRKACRHKALAEGMPGILAKPNGVDPGIKTAALLANINERFPDPELVTQTEQLWTYADIDKLLGPMEWEWEGWLAKGFATLIAAESGIGKSMLALRLAATYILGWTWPDGTPYLGPRGRVLWCETEAGEAMNRDRMRDWGIPMEEVIVAGTNPLDGISLESLRDVALVRRLAERDDVRLIIIDSLSGSHTKSEAENEVGLLVKAVAQIARDAQKPVVITHHLNKQFRTNRTTLLNVRGSTAIAQYVRLVWSLDAPNKDDSTALRLYVIKNNLSRRPAEIGLRILENGMSSIPVPQADEATDNPINKAKEALLDLVTEEGIPVDEIEEAMKRIEVSMSTARRAKADLRLDTVSRGGRYLWAVRPGTENLQ